MISRPCRSCILCFTSERLTKISYGEKINYSVVIRHDFLISCRWIFNENKLCLLKFTQRIVWHRIDCVDMTRKSVRRIEFLSWSHLTHYSKGKLEVFFSRSVYKLFTHKIYPIYIWYISFIHGRRRRRPRRNALIYLAIKRRVMWIKKKKLNEIRGGWIHSSIQWGDRNVNRSLVNSIWFTIHVQPKRI